MTNFRTAKYGADSSNLAVDDPNKTRDLTSAEIASLQALVSGGGNPSVFAYSGVWSGRPAATAYLTGTPIWITDIGNGSVWRSDGTVWRVAPGTLLAEVTPNTLLTDTDTTMRQVGFVTIPGGMMTTRSRLEVGYVVDLTGNDSKTLQLRAGPFSGTFAAATSFSGLSGATTQKYVGGSVLLWSENSVNAQRSPPVGQNVWAGNNTNNPTLALAIDTALDWNIYIGFQSAVASGSPTNSATLRNLFVRMIG